MKIIGISAFYHDSAACLIDDGMVISAVQEERFTRIRHDNSFPKFSIDYCLSCAGIKADQVDYWVFYDKPFLKFERLFETYMAFAPRGFKSFAKSLPIWAHDKLFQKKHILDILSLEYGNSIDWNSKLLFSEHHLSHAASAFFPSPFESASILTLDGVGEWATTSLSLGNSNKIKVEKELHFPHSIGLLYSAFTYFTGFKVNSAEYKVMGLAPYGSPIYVNVIKDNLIDIKDDGSFKINMKFFDYCTGDAMTNKEFDKLFGGAPRLLGGVLEQRELDLAASIQAVTEEVVIKLARDIRRQTGSNNLCLAGGVALNCVANGKLKSENIFENIWVQPAAGDSGGALGAALSIYHIMLDKPRYVNGSDSMRGSYLGPNYTQDEIENSLKSLGAIFDIVDDNELLEITVNSLLAGDAVGWHQGRMEFGPRALGARSILADPRSNNAQKHINLKVKFRESFRPFAPSVLVEHVSEWFDMESSSPYMLFVAQLAEDKKIQMSEAQLKLTGIDKLYVRKSIIPAVTHVDYSARLQTVDGLYNKKYYNLIAKFNEVTGCPVLVNTSFNIRGEPIVNTPEDAFKCFMGTDIELLVIGNCILKKSKQVVKKDAFFKSSYELD